MEMNQILCELNETGKANEIKLINSNIDEEMRVHEEILLACHEFQMVRMNLLLVIVL